MVNYKHLHYFWTVAREGSIARASERLHLTPQTISAQLGLLETQLGGPLFNRTGRKLELNETGKLVLNYANKIFTLGDELEDVLKHLPGRHQAVFRVGVADVVPKSIAYRLLAPAISTHEAGKIVCREGSVKSLLGELALQRLDMIISDSPIPPGVSVRGFNHLLGDCGLSFMATDELASTLTGKFPACLDGKAMIFPGESTELSIKLSSWLEKQNIQPHIVGEFDDSALMKVFGRAGVGIFPVPTPIEKEVIEQFEVKTVGRTEEVRDGFYAISIERKISHPAVSAITEAARDWLNAGKPGRLR